MRWRAAGEYVHVRLGGQSYLLPWGQKIVDFHVGLQINESGVLLWNALGEGADEEELLMLLCRRFQAQGEEILLLRRDLEEFLLRLEAKGAVTREADQDCAEGHSGEAFFFRAGSLKIAYRGPEAVWQKFLKGFGCEAGKADQRVEVLASRPLDTVNGRVLVRSSEFLLMEGEAWYVMLLPVFPEIYELHVSRDGSLCRIYCRPEMSEEEQEHIFHAMRFGFLVLAQERGLAVVHSASLLYRERAWLFAGKSGTGKSTHTSLWRDAWGVTLLNGDLNCLGEAKGRVWVYGLPWCGTSGISTPETYPLGGVVFLKQWRENQVQELAEAEKVCLLAMRMITPAWTGVRLKKNLEMSEQILRHCMAARLCCTREPEAAEVMRGYIDERCDAGRGSADVGRHGEAGWESADVGGDGEAGRGSADVGGDKEAGQESADVGGDREAGQESADVGGNGEAGRERADGRGDQEDGS